VDVPSPFEYEMTVPGCSSRMWLPYRKRRDDEDVQQDRPGHADMDARCRASRESEPAEHPGEDDSCRRDKGNVGHVHAEAEGSYKPGSDGNRGECTDIFRQSPGDHGYHSAAERPAFSGGCHAADSHRAPIEVARMVPALDPPKWQTSAQTLLLGGDDLAGVGDELNATFRLVQWELTYCEDSPLHSARILTSLEPHPRPRPVGVRDEDRLNPSVLEGLESSVSEAGGKQIAIAWEALPD